jgi:hypothetical protein
LVTRELPDREMNMNADVPSEPLFVNLKDDDPDLLLSVNEARRTLPHFLTAASKRPFSSACYLVKVPLLDRSATGDQALVCTAETKSKEPKCPVCHLWLKVESIFGELMFCSVAESPPELRLDVGATFVINIEIIEDWMINHCGEAYGGFSLRVMRNRLTERDRTRFDDHTGIREFKDHLPQ